MYSDGLYVGRCALPSDVFNGTDSYDSHSTLVDMYIPLQKDGSYAPCEVYTTPLHHINDTAKPNTTKCNNWVYDKSERKTSIVMQVSR